MSPSETVRIDHPVTESDWTRIRELCCETALSGKPIADRTRWPFFGELWIGPYQRRCPEWAWVARNEAGDVEGYLTGCPDTRSLQRHLRWNHHPRLLLGILFRRWPWTTDSRSFVRRTFRLSPHPERMFDRLTLEEVLRSHPAHLHVNVAESLRGKGAGAALVEAYAKALSRIGVNGIHLFCGSAPVRFYERSGFSVRAVREVSPGVPVHLMVKTIRAA